MKKIVADYSFLFGIAGIIILLDQLTKYWIRSTLSLGEIFQSELPYTQYFRIVHWSNTGAAFGMFQSAGTLFMILKVVVALVIIYYFPQIPREDKVVRLSLSMLLGGAIGNLIDRVTQGFVTDFISVGSFPVFNVADASISCGVAILFIAMWLQERKHPSNQPQATADQGIETSLDPAPESNPEIDPVSEEISQSTGVPTGSTFATREEPGAD